MNITFIIGNIGRDAELRMAGSTPVLRFSVATTETWIVDGERKTHTDWHDCEIWGKRGEALERYMTKGKKVAIAGSYRIDEYEKDGEKKRTYRIRVNDVELLGGGESSEDKSEPAKGKSSKTSGGGAKGKSDDKRKREAAGDDTEYDDGIPF